MRDGWGEIGITCVQCKRKFTLKYKANSYLKDVTCECPMCGKEFKTRLILPCWN
jgi:uncharacterized protein (DUF2225 family)